MLREPDWQALADIQFLIYKRVADSLNAALSAVALSDIPGAGGQSPAYWSERATTKVSSVLNLFTAWEYLLRYKMGETIPERAIRPFQVNTLLSWLSQQLQLSAVPVVEGDPLLHANQETLQEALLLLYSAAFTQGANVRLEMESQARGMWFRVKFARTKPLPPTFDELLAGFADHWRARDTVFELSMARDFVRLNGGDLLLHSTEHFGEFTFWIWRAGVKRGPLPVLVAQSSEQGNSPSPPGGARMTTQPSSVTQVIAEGDLLGGATRPVSRPITSEIKPADNTPVLKPPTVAATGDSVPPRLADVRPAHFPLPPTVFGPDTQPPSSRQAIAPSDVPDEQADTAPVNTASPVLPTLSTPPSTTSPEVPPTTPKMPLREPLLAQNVAAPTPQTPELPEPGTIPPRAPIAGTGPIVVGPTPAPTPRLEEMLSVQSAWTAESSEEASDDPADAQPDAADIMRSALDRAAEPAEDPSRPADPPGSTAGGDADSSAKPV